jgi:ubiquinone/menaquinone biosynthesis C-methylase UbiE/uncharacterized protein YbaR (Trm112 family)
MKHRYLWFAAGLTTGILGLVLLQRHLKETAEGIAWQKRRRTALDVLACPDCHGSLTLVALSEGSGLHCPPCQKVYPVVDGIAQFIAQQQLTGLNKRFAQMYDWFSWGYRAFSKIAFAYIGMTEENARREITDRLEPHGGRILEVSIGPGVNLPYLVGRPDVGEIYGLDISPGQLNRCRDFSAQKGWGIQLQLGNAEQLPYQDNAFDGVFHIGGINFFNNKAKAIEEMIRVAKPGTRILICDENEKGARAYERFLPSFKRMAGSDRKEIVAPVALVSPEIQETRVFEVWNGWMYCLEFRKP